MVSFEVPPIHDIHRKLLARMFTPRKINELAEKIRQFCSRSLDPLVGTGRFDFARDLGAQVPMRLIGMLIGGQDDPQERTAEHGGPHPRHQG
jgi:cytochrome P450